MKRGMAEFRGIFINRNYIFVKVDGQWRVFHSFQIKRTIYKISPPLNIRDHHYQQSHDVNQEGILYIRVYFNP